MLNCILPYCPFYQDESLADLVTVFVTIRRLNATSYFIWSSFQTFQFTSSWPNGICLIFLFSLFRLILKRSGGGGGVIWADGLHVHVRTYHVPELVHPESVAVMTIVSLHVVFSDFINIFKPNQLPENTCICQINWKTTGRIGSCIFQMGSIYDRRLNIISWIE